MNKITTHRSLFIIRHSFGTPRFLMTLTLMLLFALNGKAENTAYWLTDKQDSRLFIDQSVSGSSFIQENLSIEANTIHIVSHGRPGELFLEGEWKDAKQIAMWANNNLDLSNKKSIYLYGCEFAKGYAGKQAVKYLEISLSIGIAASTNITGKNGDWSLEIGQVIQANKKLNAYPYNLQCWTNPLADCDGDGLNNSLDQDDDNDGIPDVYEGFLDCSDAAVISRITTDISVGAGSNTTLFDGLSQNNYWFNQTTFTTERDVFNMTFTQPTILTSISVAQENWLSFMESGAVCDIEGSNDGTTWVVFGTVTQLNNNTTNPGEEVFNFPNTTPYTSYRIVWKSGGGTNWPWMYEINYTQTPCSPTYADTDSDGIPDFIDLDSDNDGILDAFECTPSGVMVYPFAATIGYGYAQDDNGCAAEHFGDQGTGGVDDPELLFDADMSTELRLHDGDIIEYAFGVTIPMGTALILIEGAGGNDANTEVYVTTTSMDPAGDSNNGGCNGVAYENTVTNGGGTLIYSGASGADVPFIMPINATHIQLVGAGGGHGGWAELEFDNSGGGSTIDVSLCDTDGDGLYDQVDLDSDDDGCPDALEAAGGVSVNNLASNESIDILNHGGVDSDGVPVIVNGGGQGQATSTSVTDFIVAPTVECATFLPVEVVQFDVKVINNSEAEISWATISERDNDYFEIHRSKNLVDWEFVGQIKGAGNSNQLIYYITNDESPIQGTSYYRLLQFDFDGAKSEEGIRSIDIENLAQPSIYPNPTNGKVTITGNSKDLENLILYNSLGKKVGYRLVSDGDKSKRIDISHLNNGIYILKIGVNLYKIIKH